MTSGEITSVVTIIGLLLTTVGANVDPSLIQGAVQGVIALITFGAAMWTWYQHRGAVAQLGALRK